MGGNNNEVYCTVQETINADLCSFSVFKVKLPLLDHTSEAMSTNEGEGVLFGRNSFQDNLHLTRNCNTTFNIQFLKDLLRGNNSKGFRFILNNIRVFLIDCTESNLSLNFFGGRSCWMVDNLNFPM